MNNKTFGAIALVAAAITTPVFAQYGPPVRGPIYHGQSYYGNYGPAYGMRSFRGAYNQMPGPFLYGDGWLPESIWDHSRVGGVDPTIRPSGN
jgi:hypothetical protein